MHNSKAILIFLLLGITLTAASQGKKIKKSVNPVKSDTTHVVGHAHMDMCWLWGYSETMKMSLDNLRQTVAFMDEFPDYKMIQSQAAIFDFVEKEDPRLFEKVKKYVIEGRLEPGGGMWTESDQNLTSGEGLVRAFLLGQGYFQSRFFLTTSGMFHRCLSFLNWPAAITFTFTGVNHIWEISGGLAPIHPEYWPMGITTTIT
jgi:alpha-mannosidase